MADNEKPRQGVPKMRSGSGEFPIKRNKQKKPKESAIEVGYRCGTHQVSPFSDRDFSDAELEFFRAVEEFKKRFPKVKFPSLSDLFQIMLSLGYKKTTAACPQAAVGSAAC